MHILHLLKRLYQPWKKKNKKKPQYWKTKKFFKNQGFCFQPVTTANDGVQSDMERAYRFSIFAENLKVQSLNTFWEKTWTSKKIKSLISRDREWQSTIGQYFKNIYLCSVRYKRFIKIGYSVFLENVTKKIIIGKKKYSNKITIRTK